LGHVRKGLGCLGRVMRKIDFVVRQAGLHEGDVISQQLSLTYFINS
jgi:hypothetical protein